jgi:general secretion pathway protein B
MARPDSGPPAVGGNPAARLGAGDSGADAEFGPTADLPAVESEPAVGQAQPPGDAATSPAGAGQQSEHVTNDLPSAGQLVASGAIPPQTLHLDIHVYSKVPAERFVFINMRKYGEGALLPEGAKIEEITQDGVVLSEAGQRFTLSRD